MSERQLWQRALDARAREKKQLAAERHRITRNITVSRGTAGVQCTACGKLGAIFGDPRTAPMCGNCWRRAIAIHATGPKKCA